MICTFCGHSICNKDDIYPKLKTKIEKLIIAGVSTFYSGGYGCFDMVALRVIGELKKEYPHIRNILVFAYLSESHISQYRDILINCNAESIYPFESKILPRFAIIKRNEWMVDNSDYLISETKNHFGGSGKTLEYAQRKHKKIIFL